ncbi:MAG TPA: hypothetical protein VIY48_05915, partial [Candidatus Paceibacterota bacterium]
QLLSRPRHGTDVGPALSSPSYNLNQPGQHASEGLTAKATDCGIVLATRTPDGTNEYRVGRFKTEEQIQVGLRRPDAPMELNPAVAKSCFGESNVFLDEIEATKRAQALAGSRAGVKILRVPCTFPQ